MEATAPSSRCAFGLGVYTPGGPGGVTRRPEEVAVCGCQGLSFDAPFSTGTHSLSSIHTFSLSHTHTTASTGERLCEEPASGGLSRLVQHGQGPGGAVGAPCAAAPRAGGREPAGRAFDRVSISGPTIYSSYILSYLGGTCRACLKLARAPSSGPPPLSSDDPPSSGPPPSSDPPPPSGDPPRRYSALTSPLYLIAVWDCQRATFASWDEVEAMAEMLGLPTVPVLFRGRPPPPPSSFS
jgi:hypothetical protein